MTIKLEEKDVTKRAPIVNKKDNNCFLNCLGFK